MKKGVFDREQAEFPQGIMHRNGAGRFKGPDLGHAAREFDRFGRLNGNFL